MNKKMHKLVDNKTNKTILVGTFSDCISKVLAIGKSKLAGNLNTTISEVK